MSNRHPTPRPTHDRLRSLEARVVTAERERKDISRAVVALLRRIFRRCQGKRVNHLSRQMTPEEAISLHVQLQAHGVQTRKGSSVNEAPARHGA